MPEKKHITAARPPVVAVVGHIDHGKSTLLDYIRKSNVVSGEAGGITQHLSAYEAVHENATGAHRITFLDTPGHEAFKAMRSRGLEVADVAILIVSAEEGAKPQTIEALKLITEAAIPYIVAFTKIDKEGANIEKAKMSMLEHQVFLEGLGGDVPWVPISGKSGEGIPELLDLILLAAELEELTADPSLPGSGLIIEAHIDNKRGSTATLMVQNGSVTSGQFVVAGDAFAPVRIMENFLGKAVKEAGPSMPVRIVGFSSLPAVGETWKVVGSKKEAESVASAAAIELKKKNTVSPAAVAPLEEGEEERIHVVLPLIIKTDVAGTGEAVVHELEKLPKDDRLEVRVVSRSVGPISESDVKIAGSGKMPGIIVGFNVKVEREARELAERMGVEIETFDIIYKLAEWLAPQLEKRRPRALEEEVIGAAKILKFFSNQKNRIVIGGRLEEGFLAVDQDIRIMRRDIEIGRGKIVSLQSGKSPTKKLESGEFGAMIKADAEPAAGDRIEAFTAVYK